MKPSIRRVLLTTVALAVAVGLVVTLTKRVEAQLSRPGNTVVAQSLSIDSPTLVVDNVNHRVGMGTTAPATLVHAFSASAATELRVEDSDAVGTAATAMFTAKTSTGQTRVTSYGAGNTSTRWGLTLGNYNEIRDQGGNGLIVGTLGSSPLIFGMNSLERARIDSTTGNFVVNTGVSSPVYITTASSVLAVTTNTITPTGAVHHVGAGLIKTITVPAQLNGPGSIALIPDAAFTYDATGNIVLPAGGGTAVVNRVMFVVWDGTKWAPSY
jgi:hypothetical protein